MQYRIIDFHAHAFPESIAPKAVRNLEQYYSVEIPLGGRIENLLASARESHVEKLIVHASATHPGQVTNINNWTASIINDIIIGFGTIHPDFTDYKKELKRIQSMGLRGIKLHPEFQHFDIDDPRMFPIYKEIGPSLPILFHMGDEKYHFSSPRKLKRVLRTFPQLKVIAAHLGGYARWKEARSELRDESIYFDTSSCLRWLTPEEAGSIIKDYGVDKVLFGTDYPIASHQAELQRFMKLPFSDEERRKILWENACKLLDIT